MPPRPSATSRISDPTPSGFYHERIAIRLCPLLCGNHSFRTPMISGFKNKTALRSAKTAQTIHLSEPSLSCSTMKDHRTTETSTNHSMGYRSFLSEREKVGKKVEKAPHFLSKVHNYFPKSTRFFRLDDARDAPNVEKCSEKQHIFRPAVCSFALSSLTLRTHVSIAPHPPSSSGTGLDHAPRPAATIGGEVPSLPRQCADLHHGRDHRSGHRHGVSRLLARSRGTSRTARPSQRKWHDRLAPRRGQKSGQMPTSQRSTGTRLRRPTPKLQHLPFPALALHRSHGSPILFFRFHTGNTLSLR